jgi:hypothetical protein
VLQAGEAPDYRPKPTAKEQRQQQEPEGRRQGVGVEERVEVEVGPEGRWEEVEGEKGGACRSSGDMDGVVVFRLGEDLCFYRGLGGPRSCSIHPSALPYISLKCATHCMIHDCRRC